MRAVDTCVLARYVLDDDAVQSPLARDVMAGGVFISATVILELGWLLRSRYAFSRDALAETLRDIVKLPTVVVHDEVGLHWAFDRVAAGADIGDVVHLVAATGNSSFCTFDDMRREAGEMSPVPVELLT